MVLIAESGSTKCDWTLIKEKTIVTEFHTMGFNPFYHSHEEMVLGIKQNEDLIAVAHQITQVRYLGAGCSSEEKRNKVYQALIQVFSKAKVVVEHDLLGAAYATYQGEPSIIGILGTGSNSCFFDGKEISQKTPSLGFIMGDEGGGGYFGKMLVTAFCYGWLNKSVSDDFEATFQMTVNQLIHRVNSEPHANVFLASMMPFIAKHKEDSFLHEMLMQGMDKYVVHHILPYEKGERVKIHFVGSVAHYFKDSIEIVLKKHNLRLGQVIQRPGPNLVDYFIQYVL